MKKTNITETNGGIKTDSTCIVWTGPEIKCLDICAGDKLNDVVYNLATIVCDSISGTDLSSLSLQCLIDKLSITVPTEKNILNILQLLIDNDCKLKDLISAVDAKIVNTNVQLNLNLKCLSTSDIYGNPILLTQIQLDQLLIDTVCSLKTRVTSLEVLVASLVLKDEELQDSIDNISSNPIITTCISTAKPTSQAVIELASDYCNYKGYVGSISQIQALIAAQGSGLNAEFSATSGWTISPSNEAQSLTNLWIAFNSYFNRLKVIEQTCCAPSCDKIKLGVIPTFDFAANTVDLEFSAGAGTVIPFGFEDIGTEITFTDKNGLKVGPYNTSITPITIGGEVTGLYMGALASGLVTISFKTNFVLKDSNDNVILTCKDCQSTQILYSAGCCVYTNDSVDPITIIYETEITT